MSRRLMSDQVIIFLHIPKTAGVTLNSIIDRVYKKKQLVSLYEKDAKLVSDDFKNYLPLHQASAQLIRGHIPFGLHQYISKPATYITIMRHPVGRVVSHYYHAQQNPTHKHYQLVAKQGMSLYEYVTSNLSRDLDNCQTRLVSGQLHLPIGECTEATLELAKTNIEQHFAVVGLTERFDESLVLFHKLFGWKLPHYGVKNQKYKKFSKDHIPVETIKAIEQRNALDMELYHYAQLRFDQLITHYQPSFSEAVQQFQKHNAVYKKLYLCYDRAAQVGSRLKHKISSR